MAPRTVLYCPQLQPDQIFQYDVGPVFVVAHTLLANALGLMICRWYKSCANCWRSSKCASTRMTALPVNIFLLNMYFGSQTTGSNDLLQGPKVWFCNLHVVKCFIGFNKTFKTFDRGGKNGGNMSYKYAEHALSSLPIFFVLWPSSIDVCICSLVPFSCVGSKQGLIWIEFACLGMLIRGSITETCR